MLLKQNIFNFTCLALDGTKKNTPKHLYLRKLKNFFSNESLRDYEITVAQVKALLSLILQRQTPAKMRYVSVSGEYCFNQFLESKNFLGIREFLSKEGSHPSKDYHSFLDRKDPRGFSFKNPFVSGGDILNNTKEEDFTYKHLKFTLNSIECAFSLKLIKDGHELAYKIENYLKKCKTLIEEAGKSHVIKDKFISLFISKIDSLYKKKDDSLENNLLKLIRYSIKILYQRESWAKSKKISGVGEECVNLLNTSEYQLILDAMTKNDYSLMGTGKNAFTNFIKNFIGVDSFECFSSKNKGKNINEMLNDKEFFGIICFKTEDLKKLILKEVRENNKKIYCDKLLKEDSSWTKIEEGQAIEILEVMYGIASEATTSQKSSFFSTDHLAHLKKELYSYSKILFEEDWNKLQKNVLESNEENKTCPLPETVESSEINSSISFEI